MKTLKFKENLVPLILSGEKTATWRMFDEKNLTVGDELSFVDRSTGKRFEQARITKTREKLFDLITEADFKGHERYASREEMLATYRSYYGDQVKENTLVLIVDFELWHIPEHGLFQELKRLNLPEGEYVVFGSGPLWVRGIRESSDIDILACGSAWQWAKENGKVGIKEYSGLEYASFADGNIEIYNRWYPGEWDADSLIKHAEIIDGIPFVPLAQVMNWKKVMGREKDEKDLVLIKTYLSKSKV